MRELEPDASHLLEKEAPLLDPFRQQAFSVLWIATVVSNIGTWMQSAAAGWFMTSLDPRPLTVALVQVAASLPMFIFAIPAGALGDIIDRRKLIIAVQVGLTILISIFVFLIRVKLVTSAALLGFVFLAAAAAALIMPVWQSIVPLLVPPRLLQPAVALNSVGVNVSRAIGPALAGVVIAAWGMSAPFWLNAVSNIGVIAALIWWRPRSAGASNVPPERFFLAVRAGLRYARHNPHLRATQIRASGFFVFASAYWALLPLVARFKLLGLIWPLPETITDSDLEARIYKSAGKKQGHRRINDERPIRRLGVTRRQLLEEVDRPALKPLPAEPYVFAEWRARRVGIDYHVDVNKHYYSVPHRFARAEVEVRLTGRSVEVFARGERIAVHLRSSGNGKHTTVQEHMPSSHRRYANWTLDRIRTDAAAIGPSTAALCDLILEHRPHPEQGFRACLGIVRLVKPFGNARVEAAATRALDIGAMTYGSVRSILDNNLDRHSAGQRGPDGVTILHPNIRGPRYYH